MPNKKIVAFNWKMNPDSPKKADRLFGDCLKFLKTQNNKPKADIVVCPPFVYLGSLLKLLKVHPPVGGSKFKVKLGAQDVFWEIRGAYTGEISAEMLKGLGVGYVIIGHSERRKHLGETDETINKKVLAALKSGLKVILCVGEDLSVRRHGKKAVENFIKNQLEKDLKNSKLLILNSKLRDRLTIAYEPVWAIGTGLPDTPADAAETINFIKKLLATRHSLNFLNVLYGGSVNAKNAGVFINRPEIDGALVGGASLKPVEFAAIVKAARGEKK